MIILIGPTKTLWVMAHGLRFRALVDHYELIAMSSKRELEVLPGALIGVPTSLTTINSPSVSVCHLVVIKPALAFVFLPAVVILMDTFMLYVIVQL